MAPVDSRYWLLPAMNEEKTFGRILDELRNLDCHEVVVVDDGSQDRTAEIVSAFAQWQTQRRTMLRREPKLAIAAQEYFRQIK